MKFALILAGLLAFSAPASRAAEATWSVTSQPVKLVNGSPLVLRVKAPVRLQSLEGSWLKHDLSFDRNARTGSWFAIAGIALSVRPGTYTLDLKGTTPKGDAVEFHRKLRVAAARYRRISVNVPKRYTEPDKQQLQKISEDRTLKQDTFGHVTQEREWSGAFRPPLKAVITDGFGTQRVFNGEVQAVHEGLDFGAPAGAVVDALNSGTVVLARPLFFEGNCIVLDHGQGLLTLYMHLSEFDVKEGEKVTRGQRIGLVGGTGRATGPHLHIAVRWQGEYLNPATLLRLRLPAS